MKKGFTLIELLVVITILAVLTGAALPYIQGYVEDARIAKAKTDLDEIARALAVYEMREGEYPQGDVALLTGRYLNKSSVDPWGSVYQVATISGTVFSIGPDKQKDSDDDISVPYQPPLALVSAKWVDSNQSGSVDEQTPPDRVILNFSRQFTPSAALSVAGNLDLAFTISTGTMNTNFSDTATTLSTSNKGVILQVLNPGVFSIKSDTIKVTKNGTVYLQDLDLVKCLSEQPAVIIPQ